MSKHGASISGLTDIIINKGASMEHGTSQV